jgi:hypothetical protein
VSLHAPFFFYTNLLVRSFVPGMSDRKCSPTEFNKDLMETKPISPTSPGPKGPKTDSKVCAGSAAYPDMPSSDIIKVFVRSQLVSDRDGQISLALRVSDCGSVQT